VAQIIREPLDVHGIGTQAERGRRVLELLDVVGMRAGIQDRYPHEFSGGQRQRIGIARALAPRPQLIVADEPVSALDVSIQAQVLNLLKELQAQFGLTYLFIGHHLSVVKYASDRIAVMYLGRIVELAASEALFADPLHPYTEALLSAVPVPDPDFKMERIVLPGDVPSPLRPPPGCHFHPRCRYARPVCAQEPPVYRDLGREHFAACHFAGSLSLRPAVRH
jgi:oligopeptide/dipeptide ABC transporter ATP-binding protein